MQATQEAVAEWIDRVRAEYLEMPGLALTRLEMRRMWLFDASLCDAVVDALVASRFLAHLPNNTYARRSNAV
jgi:hypothetical protein